MAHDNFRLGSPTKNEIFLVVTIAREGGPPEQYHVPLDCFFLAKIPSPPPKKKVQDGIYAKLVQGDLLRNNANLHMFLATHSHNKKCLAEERFWVPTRIFLKEEKEFPLLKIKDRIFKEERSLARLE